MTGTRSTATGVIWFAGLDWWYHNRAHADFQLARRLAAHERVLLVNSIGTRLPRPGRTTSFGRRIRNKLASVSRGVRRPIPELPNFYVYSPLALPVYGSAWGRRMASALVALQVAVVSRCLRLDAPAVVVTPPTAWPIASRMRRRCLVYVRSDKHSAFTESHAPTMRAYEAALLANADHVVYAGRELQGEELDAVGDRSVFLDHGVDADLFHPGTAPAVELRDVRRPIIGYFGALRDQVVDLDLLAGIADRFPDASLVLVGPSTMDTRALAARPNVHLLGAQDHERVPAFGVCFDVAVMPWRDNEWIRACNPIKLKEYLALGLPVVTVAFPEAAHWPVASAHGTEEFLELVGRALLEPGDPTVRRAAVAGESWDARAKKLGELLR